jgi:hypothetical protein
MSEIDNPDISTILKCLDIGMLTKAHHYRVGDKIIVRVGNSDSGEPLDVAIVDDPRAEDISVYDTALSVVPADLVELINYVVPPLKTLCLDRIDVSGDNIAKYTVTIGGNVSKIKRAGYGSSFNETFHYSKCEIPAGTSVKVEVIHYNDLLMSGDFNATIEGKLKDE